MTTLIVISCLVIGAVGGAYIHSLYNDNLKVKLLRYGRKMDDIAQELKKENEALRFQIEQYNIGKDAMKFTEQE